MAETVADKPQEVTGSQRQVFLFRPEHADMLLQDDKFYEHNVAFLWLKTEVTKAYAFRDKIVYMQNHLKEPEKYPFKCPPCQAATLEKVRLGKIDPLMEVKNLFMRFVQFLKALKEVSDTGRIHAQAVREYLQWRLGQPIPVIRFAYSLPKQKIEVFEI